MNIRKAFGFEQTEIEVRGQKYKLQNIPFKTFYKLQEDSKDQYGNPKATEMYDYIFKNVIIEPKVNWENFEEIEEIEELMQECLTFLTRKKPLQEQG